MLYPNVKSLLFFCLAIAATFVACKKNPIIEPEEVTSGINIRFPNVDQELWIYFQHFEEEAASRGIEIDLVAEAITGKIVEIEEEHVAGTCNFSSFQANRLVVDQSFWKFSSPLFREFIIFHELGHCSLFRGHREDATTSGVCKSIMRSGVEDCRDNYSTLTRDAYLDELFLAKNVPSLLVGN